jgi:hypothetical protein
MQPYKTVFLFTEKATSFLLAHFLLFGGSLLVMFITLWVVRNALRTTKTIDQRLFALIVMSGMFAFIQGISLYFFLDDYLPLRQLYREQKYEITEGQVHVRSTQPATGHAPGDSIMLGEHTFTIDYFIGSSGYTQTIAHQGVLTEGVNARIVSSGNTILRIDVK